MTKKTGRSAENDPMTFSINKYKFKFICLVGKSWDFHVDVALGISKDQNLENIRESAKHFVNKKRIYV